MVEGLLEGEALTGYKDLIKNDLSNSRRLQANGVHEVVAGLVQYCYGEVNSAACKMTSTLFYSYSKRQ